MAAGRERTDLGPVEDPSRIARPHQNGLLARDDMVGRGIAVTAAGELVGFGELHLLPRILRTPVGASADLEARAQEALERNLVAPHVPPHALAPHVTLAPG